MKTIVAAVLFALGICSSAQACEISPTIKMQFCADMYELKADQTAEVSVEGIPSSEFEVKRVLGRMKVVYKGKITENKKGKILIKNKDGAIVATRNISIITKDYAEGYDKVIKGTATLVKEIRQ